MLSTLVEAEKRPEFKEFLDEIYKKHRSKSTKKHFRLYLRQLIAQPFQRLPRYLLLIQDLIKNTPEAQRDHTELLKDRITRF